MVNSFALSSVLVLSTLLLALPFPTTKFAMLSFIFKFLTVSDFSL